MKKISILFLICLIGFIPKAWADPDPGENGTWFFQMNGDSGFPTGNLENTFNQGWGGEASIGFRFPHQFELSVESGYDTYSAKYGAFNGSWNIMPFVIKAQIAFGHMTVKPYVFAAAGLAFNSKMAPFGTFTGSNNEADLLTEAGLGFSFDFSDHSSFFVQSKMELDDTSGSYAADVPTVLIPVNIGVKFALN